MAYQFFNSIRLLFPILFVVFSQPILSQDIAVKKGTINIGFETGIQFTGISDAYMPINETGIGYSAGAFLDYYLSDLVKIRGGLYYDNRAFSMKDAGPLNDTSHIAVSSYYDITQKFKVNYLTVPISLIYIKGGKKFNFFLQGTLYYSVYLNSVQTGDLHVYISDEDAPYYNSFPEFNIPGDHYFEVKEEVFNPSDIGINLLLGLTYFIKPDLGITFSPGFTYSFGNVWEDPLRNSSWTRIYKINIGIIYTLKQK